MRESRRPREPPQDRKHLALMKSRLHWFQFLGLELPPPPAPCPKFDFDMIESTSLYVLRLCFRDVALIQESVELPPFLQKSEDYSIVIARTSGWIPGMADRSSICSISSSGCGLVHVALKSRGFPFCEKLGKYFSVLQAVTALVAFSSSNPNHHQSRKCSP